MKLVKNQLQRYQQPEQLILVNSSQPLSKDQIMKNQFQILVIQFSAIKKNNSKIQKSSKQHLRIFYFQKEIENKFEHLKQHNQLDIQESLNILQEENQNQKLNYYYNQFWSTQKEIKNNQFQNKNQKNSQIHRSKFIASWGYSNKQFINFKNILQKLIILTIK
ncbi:unnamed protein product [Paramecium octaurelia]|uniref:Uncharacterized protein n=1 Tax=Paramecium octaurelia TaxID=43137 RepID=A0A8S1UW25_PAROT|nr:unnamed protein product [Paramecium octaurelia]